MHSRWDNINLDGWMDEKYALSLINKPFSPYTRRVRGNYCIQSYVLSYHWNFIENALKWYIFEVIFLALIWQWNSPPLWGTSNNSDAWMRSIKHNLHMLLTWRDVKLHGLFSSKLWNFTCTWHPPLIKGNLLLGFFMLNKARWTPSLHENMLHVLYLQDAWGSCVGPYFIHNGFAPGHKPKVMNELHCLWYLVSRTLFAKGLNYVPRGFKVSYLLIISIILFVNIRV